MIRDTSATDRPLSTTTARRTRRWMALGAVGVGAAAVVAAGLLAARGWLAGERSVDADRIRIAEVRHGDLVRDITADGRVTAANSPMLYAVAAGTIALDVVAGDEVKKGQALATVSSPELKSQLAQETVTLSGLEAEVGRASLDIDQARAAAKKQVDQAEIDRQTADREVQRNREAYEAGALPELDLLRSQDALKKADIALGHARKDSSLQGKGLGFDLKTKRLALERQREVVRELTRQVDELVIRSPVDGQVGQVLVAQRANVAANAPVLTVVDLTAFELEIKVPDSYARDLAIGMPAEITSAGKKYPGRVRSVSPEVVNSEVASRIQFVGDMPGGLRQNQRLTARILLDEKKDVLMVERGPFLDSGGGNVAYIVRDGIAERRSIRTGVSSLDAVEILSGAQVGDRIVVSGSDSFGDAERIRIAGE